VAWEGQNHTSRDHATARKNHREKPRAAKRGRGCDKLSEYKNHPRPEKTVVRTKAPRQRKKEGTPTWGVPKRARHGPGASRNWPPAERKLYSEHAGKKTKLGHGGHRCGSRAPCPARFTGHGSLPSRSRKGRGNQGLYLRLCQHSRGAEKHRRGEREKKKRGPTSLSLFL